MFFEAQTSVAAALWAEGYDLDGDGKIGGFERYLIWIAAIVFVIISLGVIFKLVASAGRVGKKADRFFDDWYGEPEDAQNGRPERPGVVKRLGALEMSVKETAEATADQTAKMEAIAKTTSENTDAIASVQASVDDVKKKVDSELGRSVDGSTTAKDLNAKTLRAVEDVAATVKGVKEALDHDQGNLAKFQEQYENDKKARRREWVNLFDAIGRMIHATPDEKEQIWHDAKARYLTEAVTEEIASDKN